MLHLVILSCLHTRNAEHCLLTHCCFWIISIHHCKACMRLIAINNLRRLGLAALLQSFVVLQGLAICKDATMLRQFCLFSSLGKELYDHSTVDADCGHFEALEPMLATLVMHLCVCDTVLCQDIPTQLHRQSMRIWLRDVVTTSRKRRRQRSFDRLCMHGSHDTALGRVYATVIAHQINKITGCRSGSISEGCSR